MDAVFYKQTHVFYYGILWQRRAFGRLEEAYRYLETGADNLV